MHQSALLVSVLLVAAASEPIEAAKQQASSVDEPDTRANELGYVFDRISGSKQVKSHKLEQLKPEASPSARAPSSKSIEVIERSHYDTSYSKRKLRQPQLEAEQTPEADAAPSARWLSRFREQLAEQWARQRALESDHEMRAKWLIDNINDLHRELKQTEHDFEHYFQVTKDIIAHNSDYARQQVAQAMARSYHALHPMGAIAMPTPFQLHRPMPMPMSIPIPVPVPMSGVATFYAAPTLNHDQR